MGQRLSSVRYVLNRQSLRRHGDSHIGPSKGVVWSAMTNTVRHLP